MYLVNSDGFIEWEKEENSFLLFKMHSQTEIKIKTDTRKPRFIRVPLVQGMKGLACKTGERIQERIVPPKRRNNPDQDRL